MSTPSPSPILEAFGLPIATEPEDILEEIRTALADRVPGHVLHSTSPLTHLAGALSVVEAQTRDAFAARIRAELVDLLATLFRQTQHLGQPARGRITVTASDLLGHRTDGPIAVLVGDIELETVGDVEIPPGSSTVAIEIVAIDPGAAANGAIGDVEVSALGWIAEADGVVLDGPLSEGVDPETDAEFEARLLELMTVLTPAPIAAYAFATMARQHPAVGAAWAIERYDAEHDVEAVMHVTVVVLGVAGDLLSPTTRAAVRATIAPLLANVTLHVVSPTLVPVDVRVDVEPRPGWSDDLTQSATEQHLQDILSPTAHATPRYGDDPNPVPRPRVHRHDLIARVDELDQVEVVNSLVLQPADADDDVGDVQLLLGPLQLPTPGEIVVTVSPAP